MSSNNPSRIFRVPIYLNIGKQFENQYLTKREVEILKYVIWGYTAKRIGQSLNISFRTVEAYIDILKLKLYCHSKSEIIEKAIKIGLVQRLDIYTTDKNK